MKVEIEQSELDKLKKESDAYEKLSAKVDALSEELDEAGDDYGLEQFGEMLLTEFGYLN